MQAFQKDHLFGDLIVCRWSCESVRCLAVGNVSTSGFFLPIEVFDLKMLQLSYAP